MISSRKLNFQNARNCSLQFDEHQNERDYDEQKRNDSKKKRGKRNLSPRKEIALGENDSQLDEKLIDDARIARHGSGNDAHPRRLPGAAPEHYREKSGYSAEHKLDYAQYDFRIRHSNRPKPVQKPLKNQKDFSSTL
jgi:hypothetical protein